MKILLILLLLTGCATTSGYKANVENYNGKPVAVLLENWGAPVRAVEYEGRQYLTYYRSKHIQGISGGHGFGITRDCKTTFVIQKGVVVSYNFEGKLCRS